MKLIFLLCAFLLLPSGCQQKVQSYRLAEPPDALGEKLFQLELKRQNVVFEVSNDGRYSSSPGGFERLVAIGKEVNEKFGHRHSLQVDEGCSSKKLTEWLQSREVVFVESADAQSGRKLTLSAIDFEANDAMNRYFGFHVACVRSGAESEYNNIWKQSISPTTQAKPK